MRVQSSEPRVWGVRELLNYLSRQVRFDAKLQELGVRGEITDLSAPSGRGHLYFALKEPSGALITCFVRGPLPPEFPKLANGTEAIAFGSVGVYEYRSQFQLFVTSVQSVGAGSLAAVYERMKRKLEAEGLFEPGRKRPIPRYPFRIALVSSVDAEGAQDFRGILRRVPAIGVTSFATPVQGTSAAEAIARALRSAAHSGADVVVLARGGGSDEDRLPFNEAIVARAIAASGVPVVTAIGHRGDHHIADDVADCEVATPTAAAELLIAGFVAFGRTLPAMRERMRACVAQRLQERRARLRRLVESPTLTQFRRVTDILAERVDRVVEVMSARQAAVFHRKTERLRGLERRLAPADPRARLAERRGRVKALADALTATHLHAVLNAQRDCSDRRGALQRAVAARMMAARARVQLLTTRLDGKNPEAILQQGYAIVRSRGRVVRDSAMLRSGDAVEAQLSRGTFRARVEETSGDA